MGWGGVESEGGEGEKVAGARQTIPQGRMGLTFFPTHSLAFLVLTSPPPCPPGGSEGKGPQCWGQNLRLQQVWGLCTPLSLVPTGLLTLPACKGQTPPDPSGSLQPPGTLTKALWGAVCARMKRSECACVTTRVCACVGVWACECECGSPASPHDLSGSLFGSQGECGGGGPALGQDLGTWGLRAREMWGPLLPPRPWTIHEMGYQETVVRSRGHGAEVGTPVPSLLCISSWGIASIQPKQVHV